MKKEIEKINATPSKRSFLSIIADYDLKKSICELVDNTLDVWIRSGKKKKLIVSIKLNKDQQIISVEDNAGGLKDSELRFIIGLGHTGNEESEETIGIFGVGTKRAVVALAQDVKITTRFGTQKTFEINFDENWLKDDSWLLPYYEVDLIAPESTVIELKKLRYQINDAVINSLQKHLEEVYGRFLAKKSEIQIFLNTVELSSRTFEKWAFPPSYGPRRYVGNIPTSRGENVQVEVVAGLIRESGFTLGEYGVYFYCNNRLVIKDLKDHSVGFSGGVAGNPHFNISLTRVIVNLKGKADLMPWNSSKSAIDTNHQVFLSIQAWLIKVVKDYASLSRRWQGEWPKKVFSYRTGNVQDISIENFPEANTSFLPPLPRSKFRYADIVKKENQKISLKKPWVKGLYESVIASDLILNQNLEQRNRISLILLDSTLEIAFKEYLVRDSGQHYTNQQISNLFDKRHLVHSEIQKFVSIKTDIWKKIKYFYDLRCKLVHERATVAIPDPEIEDFTNIVEIVLKKLFGLKFADTEK